MTPQPQHPQRCTTCKDESCEFHKSKRAISIMGCPVSNVVHEFTAEKGCASHSSAQQQRIEQVIKELEKRIEQSKDEVAQAYMQDTIALLQAGDQHE